MVKKDGGEEMLTAGKGMYLSGPGRDDKYVSFCVMVK